MHPHQLPQTPSRGLPARKSWCPNWLTGSWAPSAPISMYSGSGRVREAGWKRVFLFSSSSHPHVEAEVGQRQSEGLERKQGRKPEEELPSSRRADEWWVLRGREGSLLSQRDPPRGLVLLWAEAALLFLSAGEGRASLGLTGRRFPLAQPQGEPGWQGDCVLKLTLDSAYL